MIKLENTQVVGWEPAIRGMRNPMNSWEKSDSSFEDVFDDRENFRTLYSPGVEIGPADHDLMMHLASNGPVHAKYRRMIVVYVDITAPLYWWKEFDTYKVGTVANSCSTMHKIHAKEFCADDFSFEHLSHLDILNGDEWPDEDFPVYNGEMWDSRIILDITIKALNFYRNKFLKTNDKKYWWQMIQLLPSSYNQKRTVMLNYEVLAHIYPDRKNHKLDEWHEFCRWIEQLPYSELITGIDPKDLTGTDANLN